jgi:hypothetical protein
MGIGAEASAANFLAVALQLLLRQSPVKKSACVNLSFARLGQADGAQVAERTRANFARARPYSEDVLSGGAAPNAARRKASAFAPGQSQSEKASSSPWPRTPVPHRLARTRLSVCLEVSISICAE